MQNLQVLNKNYEELQKDIKIEEDRKDVLTYLKKTILETFKIFANTFNQLYAFNKQVFLPLISTKKFQNHYLSVFNKIVDCFDYKLKIAINENNLDLIINYEPIYNEFWAKDNVGYARINDNLAVNVLNKLNINLPLNESLENKDISTISYKDLINFSKEELEAVVRYLSENTPFTLLNHNDYLDLNSTIMREWNDDLLDYKDSKVAINGKIITQDEELTNLLDLKTLKFTEYSGIDPSFLQNNKYLRWLTKNQEEPDFNENSPLFLKDRFDKNKCYSLDLTNNKVRAKFLTFHFLAMLMWKIKIALNYKNDLRWFVANENESRLDICNQYKEDNSYEQEIKPFATNTKFKR